MRQVNTGSRCWPIRESAGRSEWRGHADYLNARLAPDPLQVVPLAAMTRSARPWPKVTAFRSSSPAAATTPARAGRRGGSPRNAVAGGPGGTRWTALAACSSPAQSAPTSNGYADLAGSSVLYPDPLKPRRMAGAPSLKPSGRRRCPGPRGHRDGRSRGGSAWGARRAGGCRLCAVGPAQIDGCGRQKLSLSAVRVVAPRGTPGYPICTAPGSADSRLPASPACRRARPAGCGGAAVDAREASRPRKRGTAQLDFARRLPVSPQTLPARHLRPVFARAYRRRQVVTNTICRYPSSLPRSSPC